MLDLSESGGTAIRQRLSNDATGRLAGGKCAKWLRARGQLCTLHTLPTMAMANWRECSNVLAGAGAPAASAHNWLTTSSFPFFFPSPFLLCRRL